MVYIKSDEHAELEIHKSRFIGVIFPVSSKDELKMLIDSLKTKYPKANHYCYAAVMGDQGDMHMASDDGEPQKTAGVPILDVIKHHQLTNVCVVVIRYFGGIKLGSGGLIRAYAKSASLVVSKAKRYDKKVFDVYEITFNYHLIDTMTQFFNEKAMITEKTFLKDVSFRVIFNASSASILDDIKHLLLHVKPLTPEVFYIPHQS
ncbi:MAG: YigZ family protein [Acholeplasmataceae bacterium]